MPRGHPLIPQDRRALYHPMGGVAQNWRAVEGRGHLTQVEPPTALSGPAERPIMAPGMFATHVPFMNHDRNPLLDNYIWTRPADRGGARLVHTFVGVRNRTVYVYENPVTHSFIYLYHRIDRNAH